MTVLNIRVNLRIWACLLFVAWTAISNPARAGDGAYPQALGFSEDGLRFAFLEWGIQDGSGFAYASAYTLNLPTDSWLAAPVRALIEDENATAITAYFSALEAVRPLIKKFSVHIPARLIYARPYGYPTGTSTQSQLRWQGTSLSSDASFEATIEIALFPLTAKRCVDPIQGFALRWNNEEVYRDKHASRSRGCPRTYSLERVYIPDSLRSPAYAVALVGVYSYGFEGTDLRHIAIPIPLR